MCLCVSYLYIYIIIYMYTIYTTLHCTLHSEIELGVPDEEGRLEILLIHTKNMKVCSVV
jgi:hypothetical protein